MAIWPCIFKYYESIAQSHSHRSIRLVHWFHWTRNRTTFRGTTLIYSNKHFMHVPSLRTLAVHVRHLYSLKSTECNILARSSTNYDYVFHTKVASETLSEESGNVGVYKLGASFGTSIWSCDSNCIFKRVLALFQACYTWYFAYVSARNSLQLRFSCNSNYYTMVKPYIKGTDSSTANTCRGNVY